MRGEDGARPGSVTIVRPKTDPALWQRLSEMSLGAESAGASFASRLARENGWTLSFADRVVAEYRRFAYLAAIARSELIPSDEVDQAWRQHLLDTRHYWGPFTDALGKKLHHVTAEGGEEGVRFGGQYARTLALYENEFGKPAPREVWPPEGERFTRPLTARRVFLSEAILLPRPGLLTKTAAALIVICALILPAAGVA